MHPADLSIWLWTILFRGQRGSIFNVGSDQAVTILELAEQIAAVSPGGIKIQTPKIAEGSYINRYVPNIQRARTELGLELTLINPSHSTNLGMAPWHRNCKLMSPPMATVRSMFGLVRHHYLIAQLLRRDVILRYRGSVLGIAWSFLYPLLLRPQTGSVVPIGRLDAIYVKSVLVPSRRL